MADLSGHSQKNRQSLVFLGVKTCKLAIRVRAEDNTQYKHRLIYRIIHAEKLKWPHMAYILFVKLVRLTLRSSNQHFYPILYFMTSLPIGLFLVDEILEARNPTENNELKFCISP